MLDEAHHLLPASWRPSDSIVPAQLNTMALVTVHPDHMAPVHRRLVDTLIVVGREPQVTLDAFARGRGESCPAARTRGRSDAGVAGACGLATRLFSSVRT